MLLQKIEEHLRRMRMAPTRFGREAVGDPNFIDNLRDGRRPRPATVAKVMAYIASRPRGRGAPQRKR
jgi:hypothetical protein